MTRVATSSSNQLQLSDSDDEGSEPLDPDEYDDALTHNAGAAGLGPGQQTQLGNLKRQPSPLRSAASGVYPSSPQASQQNKTKNRGSLLRAEVKQSEGAVRNLKNAGAGSLSKSKSGKGAGPTLSPIPDSASVQSFLKKQQQREKKLKAKKAAPLPSSAPGAGKSNQPFQVYAEVVKTSSSDDSGASSGDTETKEDDQEMDLNDLTPLPSEDLPPLPLQSAPALASAPASIDKLSLLDGDIDMTTPQNRQSIDLAGNGDFPKPPPALPASSPPPEQKLFTNRSRPPIAVVASGDAKNAFENQQTGTSASFQIVDEKDVSSKLQDATGRQSMDTDVEFTDVKKSKSSRQYKVNIASLSETKGILGQKRALGDDESLREDIAEKMERRLAAKRSRPDPRNVIERLERTLKDRDYALEVKDREFTEIRLDDINKMANLKTTVDIQKAELKQTKTALKLALEDNSKLQTASPPAASSSRPVAKLQSELTQAANQITALKLDVSNWIERGREWDDVQNKLLKTISDAQATDQQQKSDIAARQLEASTANGLLRTATQRVLDVVAARKAEEKTLQEAAAKVAKLESDLSKKTFDSDALTAKLEAAEKKMELGISQRDTLIEEHKKEGKRLGTEIKGLRDNELLLSNERLKLQGTIAEREATIVKYQHDFPIEVKKQVVLMHELELRNHKAAIDMLVKQHDQDLKQAESKFMSDAKLEWDKLDAKYAKELKDAKDKAASAASAAATKEAQTQSALTIVSEAKKQAEEKYAEGKKLLDDASAGFAAEKQALTETKSKLTLAVSREQGLRDALAEIERKFNAAEATKSELETKLDEASGTSIRATGAKTAYETQIQQLTTAQNAWTLAKAKQDTRISELEGELDGKRTELATAVKLNDTADAEIKAARAEAKANLQLKDNAETEQKTTETLRRKLADELADLKKQNDVLTVDLRKKVLEVDLKEKSEKRAKDHADLLDAENTKLKASVAAAIREKEEFEEAASDAKTELANTQTDFANNSVPLKQLADLQSKTDEWKTKFTDSDTERSRLWTTVSKLKVRRAALKADLTRLASSEAALVDEVKASAARIKTLEEQMRDVGDAHSNALSKLDEENKKTIAKFVESKERDLRSEFEIEKRTITQEAAAKVAVLDGKLSGASNLENSLKSERDNLQTRLDNAAVELAEVERKFNLSISGSMSDSAAILAAEEALKRSRETAALQLSKLQTNLQDEMNRQNTMVAQLRTKEVELVDLRNSQKDAQTLLANLENENERFRVDVMSVRNAYESRESDFFAFLKNFQADSLNQIASKDTVHRAQMSALYAQIDTLKGAFKGLRIPIAPSSGGSGGGDGKRPGGGGPGVSVVPTGKTKPVIALGSDVLFASDGRLDLTTLTLDDMRAFWQFRFMENLVLRYTSARSLRLQLRDQSSHVLMARIGRDKVWAWTAEALLGDVYDPRMKLSQQLMALADSAATAKRPSLSLDPTTVGSVLETLAEGKRAVDHNDNLVHALLQTYNITTREDVDESEMKHSVNRWSAIVSSRIETACENIASANLPFAKSFSDAATAAGNELTGQLGWMFDLNLTTRDSRSIGIDIIEHAKSAGTLALFETQMPKCLARTPCTAPMFFDRDIAAFIRAACGLLWDHEMSVYDNFCNLSRHDDGQWLCFAKFTERACFNYTFASVDWARMRNAFAASTNLFGALRSSFVRA